MNKICSNCKSEKPLVEFSKNSKARDGLDYQCKMCSSISRESCRASNQRKYKLKPYQNIIRSSNYENAIEVKACNDKGSWFILDKDVYEQHSDLKFYVDDKGYACIYPQTKRIRIHTLLIDSKYIDHINRDPSDNRRMNLRAASHSNNMANRGRPSHNTSGFKGVSYYKRSQKWIAYIGYNGKLKHLGYFNCPTLAAFRHDSAVREIHGAFGVTNFPMLADLPLN